MNILPISAFFLLYLGHSLAQENVCNLPVDEGVCRALFKRFYYEPATDSCKEFYYGGCEGNGNRFKSKKECILKCQKNKQLIKTRKRKPKKTTKPPIPIISLD
uniref:Simukunin n=1 Tax=Simulium vittatum TaxID=7192 RepID=SV66_SIMVI|nr:single Kunitz protease inhibitor [Simulium vittatum]